MKMLIQIMIIAFISCGCTPALSVPPSSSENNQEDAKITETNTYPLLKFEKNSEILGELSVTVAETNEEKHRGLRYITDLPEGTGMLFPFESPRELTFVMGSVNIPLDIIFVDEKMKILNIETAPACPDGTDQECGFYKSASPAKYVVETNAGWSKTHQLSPDDTTLQLPTYP